MTALLVDTYSLFFRAFHALPPMTTRGGLPTGALYGFASLVLKLLRERVPAGTALALDTPHETFRHRAYPAYKGQREAAPSDLRRQLPLLDELIEALGLPAHRAPGYEADDVLATLARELVEGGGDALIVSGDRDVLQAVGPSVQVLFVGRRGRPPVVYDEDAVRARFGLDPRRLPSYAALVGDPSDNLPGVPGVGPRTASKLVRTHGDVAGILAHLDQVSPSRVRAALERRADQILLSERLARLADDLPLQVTPRIAPLTRQGLARARVLFDRLEFRSLIPRLSRLPTAP